MQRIYDLDKITEPFKGSVITIGNFDGVHIGHQALFYEVIEKADRLDGTSVSITFDPHPLRLLQPDNRLPLITPFEQKAELIERAGIDVLICIPFSREFAAIPAREFVEGLLVRKIGMKAIVVGEDYTFGKNREGNVAMLQSLAPRLGYEVIVTSVIRSVKGLAARVSSTAIRELVLDGEMEKAQQMLGRLYQVRGRVVTGRNRGGRLLGFPTANLEILDELCPKTGIYAVKVDVADTVFQGVANIGYSPTFNDHQFTVEVHILDFNQAIYGQKIRVNFVRRIRDEMKFASIDELKRQISADIQTARQIFEPRNSIHP
jgi:riboflavin kinase/FMN adenylyltransferase